jgi:hypothetical protein
VQIVSGFFGFVLNLVAAYLAGRPWPWIRLDVRQDDFFFGFASSGHPASAHTVTSWSGVIRVHTRGRVQFTVDDAWWLAGDGECLRTNLPAERTVVPGGGELLARNSADELIRFAADHRGISWACIQLAGQDGDHCRRVENDWRSKLREHAD